MKLSTMKNKISAPALVRHIFLGWLLAVTIEYMALPIELRALTALQGLAQMSFGRVVLGACLLSAALFGVSCFYNIE